MTCPKCGNEIAEGHLYCEVCGEEIQIVPDFDLQVEESINVTLSSVAGDVKVAPVVDAEGITKEIPTEIINEKLGKDIDPPTPQKQDKPRPAASGKKPSGSKTNKKTRRKSSPNTPWIIAGAVAGGVLVIGLLIFAITSSMKEPVDHFVLAQDYYRQGEYALAEQELKKLEEEEGALPEDHVLLLSDCYVAQNRYADSIDALSGFYANDPDNTEYLKRLMEDYIAQNNKDAIAVLLKNTGNEQIKQRFSDYIAPSPLFSLDSGTYTDDEQLSLMSEQEGEIRYTLDGSEPTVSSQLYENPFIFDVGEHTVTAIFINEKGMCSDAVQKKYVIEKKMLDDPVLLTEGGKYSDPELIRLEKPVGAVIYYTDDGSEPGVESNVYNQPIPMPIGEKTYRFIVINAQGLTSEIVEATYSLQMAALVDVTMAENAVQLFLKIGGKGVKQSEYKCSSALRVNDKNFYLVEEYSLQTAEKVKTGRVYAVDVLTGETYKLDMSSAEGDYRLTPFQ